MIKNGMDVSSQEYLDYQKDLRLVIETWVEATLPDCEVGYLYPGYYLLKSKSTGKKVSEGPRIDLSFTNKLLELKKEVNCICTGFTQDDIICEKCGSTGKVEVYVIDRERYLTELWSQISPRSNVTLGTLEHDLTRQGLVTSIAIHTATIENRLSAMATALGE